MFKPPYNLNTVLLNNIVRIKNIVNDLNEQKFSEVVLARFEKDSYAISAHASTSIEGNPIPLTDVRKILKSTPTHIRDTEKEILNYNLALHNLSTLVKKTRPLTSDFICNIQKIVTEGLIDKNNQGNFRKDPVVVNDPIKRKIAYIPPNAEDVQKLMDDLIGYLLKEFNNTDPLILAGIFHKQFVIIHPFMDGNGRTARLVTKYILASMGLDTFQLFSFENYYNQNISRYFKSVGVYGDYYEINPSIDFTDWLIYFTDGIIDELLRVQKLIRNSMVPERTQEYEKTILEYIKKHGSISEAEYSNITKNARSTRILHFKKLVDKRVLERHRKGKATFYTLGEDGR